VFSSRREERRLTTKSDLLSSSDVKIQRVDGRSFRSSWVDELNFREDDLCSVSVLLLESRGRSSSSDEFGDQRLTFDPFVERAEGVDL